MHKVDAHAVHTHIRALGLGELLGARLLMRTDAYMVLLLNTSRGRCLARLGAPVRRTRFVFEQAVRATLGAHGVRVPRLIGQVQAALLGLPVAPVQPVPYGHRAGFWVYSDVPGRRLPEFAVGPSETRQVGYHLARMHRLLRHVPQPRAREPQLAPLIQWAQYALEHAQNAAQTAEILALCKRLECHTPLVGLTFGLMHGGVTPAITQFKAGRLVGVIDFGAACRGPLVVDLARALYAWGFCKDVPDAGRMQALVEGYSRLRALSGPETRALWPQLRLQAIAMALRRIVRFEMGAVGQVLGGKAVFAPAGMLYEDYRHDLARLEALEHMTPLWG